METNMDIKTISDFRAAIRNGAYAWPGGYPIYFITADGGALSFAAAKAERRQIIGAIRHDDNFGGWKIVAAEINWEDQDLICDHTGEKIEAAYDAPEPDPDRLREDRDALLDTDRINGFDRDDPRESPDY
jgi:hypothetical protein